MKDWKELPKDWRRRSRRAEVSYISASACLCRADPGSFAGGILTIPPGFTRGLDFGPLADDIEGGLLDEEEEVEVTPIYRPMLDLSSESKTSVVIVSIRGLA